PPAARTPARAGLEKSVARVFPSPQPKRPLPERPAQTRMARGTQGPQRAVAAPHTVARASDAPAAAPRGKREVGENTATDITAVDRAWVSMQNDEQTRVNVVSAPAIAAALDDDPSIDETQEMTQVEETKVDPVIAAAVKSDSPLPRLSARLRRPVA
ncbi:MAG TPA: hypothetical protein VMZ28_08420, partial [Kofleriaceae bacterium]|nr:hypothetical protein [Kofleriaceae bacterium]